MPSYLREDVHTKENSVSDTHTRSMSLKTDASQLVAWTPLFARRGLKEKQQKIFIASWWLKSPDDYTCDQSLFSSKIREKKIKSSKRAGFQGKEIMLARDVWRIGRWSFPLTERSSDPSKNENVKKLLLATRGARNPNLNFAFTNMPGSYIFFFVKSWGLLYECMECMECNLNRECQHGTFPVHPAFIRSVRLWSHWRANWSVERERCSSLERVFTLIRLICCITIVTFLPLRLRT